MKVYVALKWEFGGGGDDRTTVLGVFASGDQAADCAALARVDGADTWIEQHDVRTPEMTSWPRTKAGRRYE